MKAKDLDRLFDEGEKDILQHLDIDATEKVNQKERSIKIEFPEWMVEQLEKEASRIGVSQQAIIKIWLSERLEQIK